MIRWIPGDITSFKGDVIVNAANTALRGGGGVDGAIHRAGGPGIMEECRNWIQKHGDVPAGHIAYTSAGKLPFRYILHAVGPVWQGGTHNEDMLLANCYINALHFCREHALQKIAFPNLSTGVYQYPKAEAAEVAIATVQNFLASFPGAMEVTFVCFDEENQKHYQRLL